MRELSGVELAGMLGITKGRVSQLVSEGKLAGCYRGDGRDRRYDPVAVARALGKRIDMGQQLGNGARTQAAAASILQASVVPAQTPSPAAAIPTTQVAEYEKARTEKAQEEARRLRRLNAEAEGTFVLAEEVARQVRRQIGQEVAEVATFIRDAARAIADRHQLDFKDVRQQMLEQWRSHRGSRVDAAEERAGAATLTDAESAGDI
ncbi:MAG: hypothetical protein QM699_07665 [Amaricoccus sp.]|uniref:hypothetical protein n=1 Tax=Amaricoccus sp. TaxID=1872485 RepID=UPI0039E653E5